MKFQVPITEYRQVHISCKDVSNELRRECTFHIRPKECMGYDDWFISSGNIIGVTEYHHGSDGETLLGKATESLEKQYEAINIVCEILKDIK